MHIAPAALSVIQPQGIETEALGQSREADCFLDRTGLKKSYAEPSAHCHVDDGFDVMRDRRSLLIQVSVLGSSFAGNDERHTP
jgi:hypothetical protein